MTKLLNISLLYVFVIFLHSCSSQEEHLFIVLSHDPNKTVTNWLKNYDSTIVVQSIYNVSKDSIDFYLNNANAVVITGGEDVNPSLYRKDSLIDMCGTIDYYRDSLEIKMINFAINSKVPLLGICRGLQIMNVAQGGSLIVDIPFFIGDSIHRLNGATQHLVILTPNSYIKSYSQTDTGTVYSNHHQAIDSLAPIFTIAAIAKDLIIEAIEIADTTNYSFTLGIQWHPEQMDYNDKLGKAIAQKFLFKAKQHLKQQ
ncbi:MAG: gamma-glutamyl-gamma-aminobutyrate hydrolase family protein [Bacteroidota bacterium]|nr:gamma-glutamyl-gamma-aminobutyrate hydrolase family protein [Bacteroidota bacterium]